MKPLTKFISISPKSFFVLTAISILSGILKSVSILLIIPLLNLLNLDVKDNSVVQYFTMFLNYFNLNYNFTNTVFFIFFTSLIAVSIIYFSMYFFQKTVIGVLVDQRKQYLNRFTNIRWDRFHKLKSGEIINASVDQAPKAFSSGFIDTINFISFAIQSAIMLFFAFLISPLFMVLAMCGGLLSYLFFSLVNKQIIKYSNEVKEHNKTYTIKLSETFHIIKSLITLNKLQFWNNAIHKIQKNYSRSMIKLYMFSQFPVQYRETFTIMLIGALTLIVINWQLTDLTTFATLLILFQRSASYIGLAQNLYQSILKMEVYYDDFHESKKMLEKNTDNSKNLGSINLIDINKFEENIIDILTGLINPTKGSIEIDGKDIKHLNKFTWRKKISYLSQKPELFNATMKENILFFNNEKTEVEIEKSIKLSGVNKFIDDLEKGINTNVGEFGNKLSGGQKQRVAISRIIDLEKDIFIFDEPTSSLDDISGDVIVNLVKFLKEKHKTIMLISHSSKFDSLADQILQI
jgi:ABC-type multidrug transport system fused ATPase/permease subunit